MSNRDFADDFNRTSRTIGLEKIAEILTQLQKRNPKIEDSLLLQYFMYSPLIDLHDTSITISTAFNFQSTREDLHFGMMKLRKMIPSLVLSYSLVHTFTGTPTYNHAKHKLGGDMILDGSVDLKTDHHAVMDMGTAAFAFAVWVREVTAATHGLSNKRDIASTTNAGFEIYITSGNTINIRISDGTNTVLLSAAVSPINLNDGNWHSIIINVPASGNLEIFVDKITKGTQARGSVTNVNNSRDHYYFARDNAGALQDKLVSLVSTWVWKKGEIFTSGQIDEWHDKGVVDLDAASNTEVTTFLFDDTEKPSPNPFAGLFVGN